jgi:hypothetical protein
MSRVTGDRKLGWCWWKNKTWLWKSSVIWVKARWKRKVKEKKVYKKRRQRWESLTVEDLTIQLRVPLCQLRLNCCFYYA